MLNQEFKRNSHTIFCIAITLVFIMIISSCASDPIEKIIPSPDNDYSKMYSRDERYFTFFAYPNGITEDDIIIEDENWENYTSISDVELEDMDDSTKITFKLTVDPAILEKSHTLSKRISIKSKYGITSSKMQIDLYSVDIADAEPITLKINEPQIVTFKVIPASLPLDELKIGMNAYISNLSAEIIDSEIDEENNCQYVHVETSVNGKHNGLSETGFSLTDIYQLKGGSCDITIVE